MSLGINGSISGICKFLAGLTDSNVSNWRYGEAVRDQGGWSLTLTLTLTLTLPLIGGRA